MKMQKLVSFVKENLKINILKLKDTLKFKIIGIIQGNIEVLHITYVVSNIVYLENFYSCS